MKRLLNLFLCFSFLLVLALTPFEKVSAASVSAGKVNTKSTSLNVRKTSSSNSEIITTLSKGTYVTLISKSADKWKVQYSSGKYGYCHSSYIKEVESEVKYVNITSGVLNVRSKSSTSSSVKDKLSKGQQVLSLSSSNGFTKILYYGTKTGYVKSDYLSSNKPSSANQKISLSVPYYNQTDSRWKDIKIGTSGDTIGSSGCTTSCLAMTESFRKGKTVTPKDMAASLKYADAGWLYWPTDYTVELTSSSTYLSSLYSLLKKNKPVIIGAKKSNGSQHWVVVTGFNGNPASPKASDFTVNDPGSKTRTTLSQFISAYPVLYKIAYYK